MNPLTSSGPQKRRLLSIGTDRSIFNEGSAVRARWLEYSKDWDEVHIIVAAGPEFKETVIGSNVWVYPSSSRIKILYPFDIIRLGRFIIKHREITEITCQDPFLTGMAGVSLKKEFNLPLELQVHVDLGSPNFTYTLGNKIRKSLALSYLPKADRIRVVSNRIKSYLVGTLGIAESKITVRPIFVNTEKIKSTPVSVNLHSKYPQFSKIALVASRLEKEKNIELALDAWTEVIKMLPKAGLIIVGKGSELERLKSRAKSLGIIPNVIFEDWMDVSTLISYYKTADVFLNTSWYEGYGMTLVEAHAAGCPIISTDVGVAREVGADVVEANAGEFAEIIYNRLS